MKLIQSLYRDIAPYITKDGSEIRELMHPTIQGNRAQSFAEATVPPGGETALHLHRVTEEIYHFTVGSGSMRLGTAILNVATGDTIAIPAGTPHCVINTGNLPMKIICTCVPAYSHDDTILISE
jgi:mannose-6-phosphate isomerase-like protein (cupin superfamily)